MIGLIGILAGLLGSAGCSMAKYEPGKLPEITQGEKAMAGAIEKDLKFLTVEVGERNAWKYENLNKTADWIEGQFREMGYAVRRQSYQATHQKGPEEMKKFLENKPFANIEAEFKGSGDGIIVIGAHYDTVSGSPGADDNGSGIAVMLETARRMAGDRCKKTVRFVAFVNEENPFFNSEDRGSLVYAKSCKQKGERIDGAICFDMLGYFRDEKRTQGYPISAGKWVYGDRGNYVMFVGNLQSWDMTDRAARAFWEKASINCERFVYPDFIETDGSSDMASFWEMGYPAVLATDTAMFRNGMYHSYLDKMNVLDMDKLGRVGMGMLGVIRELAGSDKR